MQKVAPLQPAEILFEDNHLLVINKRAGLVTQGAAAGEPSLIELAKDYVRRKYNKPGNVYLGIVSRLDALTTGAIVIARTSKAAARLTQQFKDRSTKKIYWAIVEDKASGESIPETGKLESWMYKDEQARRMRSVSESQKDTNKAAFNAKVARLSWTVIGTSERCQLLQVELQTGRKHQIRCQLAAEGYPILGDHKYGSSTGFAGAGIALHSKSVEITHPTLKNVIQFDAKAPDCWKIARYNL
jgi:23S rRNA pseudouridine1911/1915/1917 synthase